jgi:predicted nuclease of predicted toxin-antitoxin system
MGLMVLRFKLDENLPARVGPALRALGHDVETAVSEHLAGSADPRLLAACVAEDRILVTLDLDFADLRTYPPASHCGVWVLRPAQQTFDALLHLVLAGTRLASTESARGRLWVLDQRRVRIRE